MRSIYKWEVFYELSTLYDKPIFSARRREHQYLSHYTTTKKMTVIRTAVVGTGKDRWSLQESSWVLADLKLLVCAHTYTFRRVHPHTHSVAGTVQLCQKRCFTSDGNFNCLAKVERISSVVISRVIPNACITSQSSNRSLLRKDWILLIAAQRLHSLLCFFNLSRVSYSPTQLTSWLNLLTVFL